MPDVTRVHSNADHLKLPGEPDAEGTLWIAEGVGLVRSRREYLPGEQETMELVRVEQAS